ncbi:MULTISPECIES: GntR family transcriptional regulator [Rhizobium]|uniref:GntR family transcriptional regulator n=1 Tax=Rhizobium TaxID=379 RepID=UPI000BE81061|nr:MULTISPECIES: GntR family transcriptional regulator [Rhizobium]MBB3522803.1 DNA-binding GntR family transcriptional regulator [Rhizobium sp. BK456]MBY4588652.1 GntR family transcriptional regulator [Rhizobium redzepovicii]MBY4616950.1 GntR family transcriptional regulator [Rhizobium redzepovicii]MDF0658569.1 GntR family transcriptional regulator [Rhizobium sp. BC49]PDS82425.1 GntR family transcriptional regulator [Rhizobium sp. L18]
MQTSQSHLAYLALEHLIVTLALKPGALVTEKQLIDMAGHGRTPVREAIQKLAWQGLILVKPRVGLQIAEIAPEDHGNVMQVRRELEPIAASLVAEHATDEQRGRLGDCARAMDKCAATGDLAGFFAADKTFDEILEEVCPNGFITAALGPVQTHSRRLWYSTANPERMDRAIALHVAVIQAIHRGKPDAARAAMAMLIDYLAQT